MEIVDDIMYVCGFAQSFGCEMPQRPTSKPSVSVICKKNPFEIPQETNVAHNLRRLAFALPAMLIANVQQK